MSETKQVVLTEKELVAKDVRNALIQVLRRYGMGDIKEKYFLVKTAPSNLLGTLRITHIDDTLLIRWNPEYPLEADSYEEE